MAVRTPTFDPNTWEYAIPADKIDDAESPNLPPEFAALIGRSASDIEKWLTQRLESVCCEPTRRMYEFIRGFHPHSLITHSDSWWLCLRRPFALNERTAENLNSIMVPPIDDRKTLAISDGSDPFQNIPELSEWIRHFGGLSNWVAPTIGIHVPNQMLRTSAYDLEWGEFGDWADTVVVGSENSGDLLLINDHNKAAYWSPDLVMSEDVRNRSNATLPDDLKIPDTPIDVFEGSAASGICKWFIESHEFHEKRLRNR